MIKPLFGGSPLVHRPLVMATGVFDLLHIEHVLLLEFAKRQGCTLLVGINTDESVQRLKGPNRPIISCRHRTLMLESLRCVDEVTTFSEDTPEQLIKHWKPDVLVKGHDYRDKPVPEAEIIARWGGRLVIAPTSSRVSTSQIINHIRSLPA